MISRLHAACDTFAKMAAALITEPAVKHNLGNALAYCEKVYQTKLTPGPAGTKGQIFYMESQPTRILKLTTDESEAKNMFRIMRIQQTEKGFAGVVSIFSVFKVNAGGAVYAIEQEKGLDLTTNANLYRYIKKILFMTGPNLKPTSTKFIKAILEDMQGETSSKLRELGLTGKTIIDKVDPYFGDIKPSNMVYIPSPKDKVKPIADTGHPSDDDYLKEVDKMMRGKIKMTDIGYGSNANGVQVPVK